MNIDSHVETKRGAVFAEIKSLIHCKADKQVHVSALGNLNKCYRNTDSLSELCHKYLIKIHTDMACTVSQFQEFDRVQVRLKLDGSKKHPNTYKLNKTENNHSDTI